MNKKKHMLKKHFLYSLLLSFFFFSCSSDETSMETSVRKYVITFSAGDGGTVSTTGGEYELGQTVNVAAIPQEGYIFKDWSDGNKDLKRVILVNGNLNLIANFEVPSDFDSNSNTVLLRQVMYGAGDVEVVVEERVSVTAISGSRHKVFENNEIFYIIQLNEDNNVVYGEDGTGRFFMTSHNEMPQLIDNHILSDVNLNMEVYYSNAQDPHDSNAPSEAYEYIWDNGNEGVIGGKQFIASKFKNTEKYGTPVDVSAVKFGNKWRAQSNSESDHGPITELVYKELATLTYKDIIFEYEVDLYNGEEDFLEKIKPNFDKVYENLKGTNAIDNLNTIYIYGGRTYTCGGESKCDENIGYIWCFTTIPDVGLYTHEIGHTWSLRAESPVDWDKWQFFLENYYCSDYALQNETEYFSEAFMCYFSGQQLLINFPNQYQLANPVREQLDLLFN